MSNFQSTLVLCLVSMTLGLFQSAEAAIEKDVGFQFAHDLQEAGASVQQRAIEIWYGTLGGATIEGIASDVVDTATETKVIAVDAFADVNGALRQATEQADRTVGQAFTTPLPCDQIARYAAGAKRELSTIYGDVSELVSDAGQTVLDAHKEAGQAIVDAHQDLEQTVHETGLLLQDLAGDLSDSVVEVYDELLS